MTVIRNLVGLFRKRLCPRCSSSHVNVSHRKTNFERALSGAFYIRPFRCRECQFRFWHWEYAKSQSEVVSSMNSPIIASVDKIVLVTRVSVYLPKIRPLFITFCIIFMAIVLYLLSITLWDRFRPATSNHHSQCEFCIKSPYRNPTLWQRPLSKSRRVGV